MFYSPVAHCPSSRRIRSSQSSCRTSFLEATTEACGCGPLALTLHQLDALLLQGRPFQFFQRDAIVGHPRSAFVELFSCRLSLGPCRANRPSAGSKSTRKNKIPSVQFSHFRSECLSQ